MEHILDTICLTERETDIASVRRQERMGLISLVFDFCVCCWLLPLPFSISDLVSVAGNKM
jgi:hypothetical protein